MKNNSVNGIVIKVTEEYVVLMTEEGTFKNVPRSPLDKVPILGQRFNFIEKQDNKFKWQKYTLIAAVFLMVFISSTVLLFKENQPAYIVAIDINPSIEIFTDDNLRVIKAQGLNVEGQEIIESISEDNLMVFIEEFINLSVKKSYLYSAEQSAITTTVINLKDRDETILEYVRSSINQSINNNKVSAEVVVSYESKYFYEEAKRTDLSLNYYKLFNDLKNEGIVHDIDEIRGKKISELTQMKREIDNESKLPQPPSPKEEHSEENDFKKEEKGNTNPTGPDNGKPKGETDPQKPTLEKPAPVGIEPKIPEPQDPQGEEPQQIQGINSRRSPDYP